MRIIKKGKKPGNLNTIESKTSLDLIIQNRNAIKLNQLKKGKKVIEKISPNDKYYRGNETKKNSALYHLKNIYKDKCAYCESKRTKLDVDHYRPKDAISVKDEKSHNGYYWLCYEWSNLIYVCKECNRDYKNTRFPITKKRVYDTKILSAKKLTAKNTGLQNLNKTEAPLILNPEEKDFNPLNYIEFDSNGVPKGTDLIGRGNATIEIMKLDRPDLVEERFLELESFISLAMVSMYNTYIETKNKTFVKKELQRLFNGIIKSEKDRHTLFWKYVYLKFDKFVLDHTDLKKNSMFRAICIEAFKEKFKSEILKEKPHFL